ncbi:MAG: four helix bundle protein [Deltaproteobacteria bacterium]|nr:four helix bundle protein [Deltaproteobacteria bacterium]
MKDFRELKVWQMAMELFMEVVRDVEAFPKTEVARIIANQILRSVSSITANIAEGYGRRKGKEFQHYLYIARGSANETIDWYEKLKRLGYIGEEIFEKRGGRCQELRAMLTKMIDSV